MGGIGEGKKEGTGTYLFRNGEWIPINTPRRGDEPIREDYALCRDLDKTITDYKRFKGRGDRERIKNEYFGKQEEYRQRKEVKDNAREAFKEAF